MPLPWNSWRKRYQRLARQAPPGPLQAYYAHPPPVDRARLGDCEFVVLDFETTGLDLDKDQVVSFGLVEIHGLGIRLGTALHHLVRTTLDMPERSAVIHCITDDMVQQGLPLEQALAVLLPVLQGKVLIAHHAEIELGFLNKACRQIYDTPFIMPNIDTQKLAMRQMKRDQDMLEQGALRLFNLLRRYGLPVHKAHHALNDALSTAELFLALTDKLCPKHNCRVSDYTD